MERNDLLLISDYLAGELTAAERTQFEQRLQVENELVQLLEAQRLQQAVLIATQRAETKARLQAQFASVSPTAITSPTPIRRLWLGAALAIAASLALLLWFAPWQNSPDLNTLALAEIEPYPLTVERGGNSLSTAQELYQAGNYAEALPLFSEWIASYPGDDGARLYRAECLSLLGEYAAAVEALQAIPAQSPYADAVSWRLALNHILAGQPDAAKTVLQDIQGRSHYKNKAAAKLLDALTAGDS